MPQNCYIGALTGRAGRPARRACAGITAKTVAGEGLLSAPLQDPRRVALTGATGLVGGAVLAAAPSGAQVRALYRAAPGEGAADWVQGSLSDDAALARLCEGADTVIHVAGATASLGDRGFHAVNVLGAARLASAARRAGARRFVLISSQAAQRPGVSAYARSKRLGEEAVRRAAGGMAVTVLRPPAVFGPGDEATEPLFAAMRRGVLPVPGGRGWRTRRFAAVTAQGLAREVWRAAAGEAASGVPAEYPALGWEDLARASAAAGFPVRLLPVPPTVLAAAGRAVDLAARLARRPQVFGAGKAAEMAFDWTASGPALTSAPLDQALGPLLASGARPPSHLARRAPRGTPAGAPS